MAASLGLLGRWMTAVMPSTGASFPAGVVGTGTPGLEAGAAARRLRNFQPGPAHVNTLIAAAGRTVTQRARWLARNNGYAVNAVDWWGNTVVGPGISPSWLRLEPEQKKALRSAWDDWTDEADAEGLTDFYGLQRRAARELFIAGEVFIRLRFRRPGDGLTVPLQLQMLPSEMLDPNDNRPWKDGVMVRQGVEFDRLGRRTAYWFWKRHPADSTEPAIGLQDKVRVPADQVMHLMDAIEGGQIRGLSRFSNAIVPMFMLDQYDDSELTRKQTAALYTGFIKRRERTENTEEGKPDVVVGAGTLVGGEEGVAEVSLEPGSMMVLDYDDEDVKFSEPADVGGNYDVFQYRTLLRIGSALGVPYFALTGDTSKANYSSLRAALIDARKRIEAFQWSVVIFGMCRPVLSAWLTQAALVGAVPELTAETLIRQPARFRKVRWMLPPWASADPYKDRQEQVLAIQHRLKARSDVIEGDGFDAAETDERIAEDQKREKRLGIEPAPTTGGAPRPQPPEKEEE